MQPPIRGLGAIWLSLLLSLTLTLFSCSYAPYDATVGETPPSFSVFCLIHGDGNYLYHDSLGIEHRADREALEQCVQLARQNPEAEVFIFHEKPRESILFIPVPDGDFYYYRKGVLVANESYWRHSDSSRYEPVENLYSHFSDPSEFRRARLFFYFGHEVPESDGMGYDASYPEDVFSVHDLGRLLNNVTDSVRFDLVTLSTCFGGTPFTIRTLAPYSRFIVASPENLHLSFFDLHPVYHLEETLAGEDVSVLANRFAQNAFEVLTNTVFTAVTVVLYDVSLVRGYVDSVNDEYASALDHVMKEGDSWRSIERCDCAENPDFILEGMKEGVRVFYRPPLFGRLKDRESHSGWECLKVEGSPLTSPLR